MARFLMWTGAATGHVTPSMPIARELVECGHEIAWITGRQYQASVESCGATFHPYPKELDPDGMEIYDFFPELKRLKGLAQMKYWIKHVFLDACSRSIETIDEVLADFSADVLLGDTIAFGLYFCSEKRGLPFALISLLPLAMPSRDIAPWGLGLLPGKSIVTKTRNRLLNWLVAHIALRDITTYANRTLRKLGLEQLNGPFFYSMFENSQLFLHLSTPAFEYPRAEQDEKLHYVGPILPLPNPTFQPPLWWSDLDDPRPVILVNQGTIAKDLNDLVVPTIAGLRSERMLVVAVPVEEGQLGERPENTRTEPFIPFGHLLPYVDVMVTNGGYGGTQRALAQGIPLVVSGETDDKMEVAARVEWSGAGINLRKKRPSADEIRNAVKEVLANPTYRENAKRIQADFAKYNAPAKAAELLEALACGLI
ncbi:MAG: glycosyltransferase [Planctomycetota bacterium]|jgi:MGT family glycosyltransferase